MTINSKRAVVSVIVAAVVGAAILPAAASAAPVRTRSTAAALPGQEFDGFGEARAPAVALNNARADARNQARAHGYDPASQCTTTFEDLDPPSDPGNPSGLWIGESDLFCSP